MTVPVTHSPRTPMMGSPDDPSTSGAPPLDGSPPVAGVPPLERVPPLEEEPPLSVVPPLDVEPPLAPPDPGSPPLPGLPPGGTIPQAHAPSGSSLGSSLELQPANVVAQTKISHPKIAVRPAVPAARIGRL
jgi:hypothetical protein